MRNSTEIEIHGHAAPKRSRKKRVIAGVALAAVLIGGASAAFAYWTADATGTGQAGSGTDSSEIKFVQTNTVSNVNPGAPAQELKGHFENTGTGDGYITSLSAVVTGVTSDAAGLLSVTAQVCDPAWYTITGGPATIGANFIPGVSATVYGGLSISMPTNATNQDGCKNKYPVITYTATPAA